MDSGGSTFSLGVRPSLDGVRGIAIVLVMINHATLLFWSEASEGFSLGVDIFFVLSGFLITSLLLEEHRRIGRLSFRRFYARRALRLLPPLFIVLGAFVAYVWNPYDTPSTADILLGVTATLGYFANFVTGDNVTLSSWLGQMWSLSIEEQFYLVWPAAIVALLAASKGRARSVISALASVTVAFVLWRLVLLHVIEVDVRRLYLRTDARADELLVGALLAALVHFGAVRVRGRPRLAMCSLRGIFVLALVAPGMGDRRHFDVAIPLVELLSVALILSVLSDRGSVAMLLRSPPLRWLGRLSYALYLVHVPVFVAVGLNWSDRNDQALLGCVVGVAVTFAAAMALHHFVERPMARYKYLFAAPSALPSEAGDSSATASGISVAMPAPDRA